MTYVFFIYGLAFFTLGLSIALYPKEDSAFWFARTLRYIAAFGILHGLNEWLDMFILIQGIGDLLYIQITRALLLGASFFCLLEFGVKSLRHKNNNIKVWEALPPALIILWALSMMMGDEPWFRQADIWGRYLLGFPGILMTFYAFRLQLPQLRQSGLTGPARDLSIASAAFFAYAILSGLIVPEADFFPASTFNYTNFMELTGLPVQGFRAACAIVAAYSMYRVLQVFDWETKNKIIRARDEMEVRVEERTRDLRITNEELEHEIGQRSKAEEFNRNVLESVDEGFVVIDRDYNIVTANKAYCNQAKQPIDDIIGKHCYQISHRIDTPCFNAGEDCAVKHTFETGKPYTSLHTHHDAEGNSVYVETKAFPLTSPGGQITQVIETINDITEKIKLENQLRHSQKLEAIGTLTGGIAHDFNNILTTILGYGEFLQEEIDKDSPLKVYVDMIMTSSERAANLTQSLLAFSRKQITNPKVINISAIFSDMQGLLSRVIGEDIKLTIDTVDKGINVRADKGQIEQVLLNLASNARDAMQKGGSLSINAGPMTMDKTIVDAYGFGEPGNYCLITVSDTGIGMDKKVSEQIFEPFYTTKEVGKGTGLGLAIVYGLIRQHGGYINVYSEPTIGTTFKIYLPLVGEMPEEDSIKSEPIKGGTETILIAEDNESIRELLKTALGRAGYTTLEAVNGEEAVAVVKDSQKEINLLLVDVIMPRMDGKEVYETISKMDEKIKVLFMSGYSESVIHSKGILMEGLNFISKPVSPKDLLRKVREILDK